MQKVPLRFPLLFGQGTSCCTFNVGTPTDRRKGAFFPQQLGEKKLAAAVSSQGRSLAKWKREAFLVFLCWCEYKE